MPPQKVVSRCAKGIVAGIEPFIDTIVVCTLTALVIMASGAWNRGPEATYSDDVPLVFSQITDNDEQTETAWTIPDTPVPGRTPEAMRITGTDGWNDGEGVFLLIQSDDQDKTGANLHRLEGKVVVPDAGEPYVQYKPHYSQAMPTLAGRGLFAQYTSSTLTGHAFDRVTPGLGKWLVTLAVWLFAISTMISWSYYGYSMQTKSTTRFYRGRGGGG